MAIRAREVQGKRASSKSGAQFWEEAGGQGHQVLRKLARLLMEITVGSKG